MKWGGTPSSADGPPGPAFCSRAKGRRGRRPRSRGTAPLSGSEIRISSARHCTMGFMITEQIRQSTLERAVAAPVTQRLVALDAFRGATIALMVLVNDPGDGRNVYGPLQHAEWHGWTITDVVFPSFLWIAGVAMALVFA